MSDERRSVLEPHDNLQRVLYAAMVPMLPYCIWKIYPHTQDDVFLLTAIFWWLISAFYTFSAIGRVVRRCLK